MSKTHKTSKGTELPILNLRGKDYLEVKYRLIWFREDHPDWSIETEMMSVTANSSYAKATIKDDKGRVITTSHKFESAQGFPDFIEKSETGAIGRALALIGYGTQFCADELNEADRIVDSPVAPKAQQQPSRNEKPRVPEVFQDEDYGDFICDIGRKFKGQKLKNIGENELNGYVKWLKDTAKNSGKGMDPSTKIFVDKAEAYLVTREFTR